MFLKEYKYLNGNFKGIIYLFFFRTSAMFSRNIILKIIGFPIRFFYYFFFQWVLGFDVYDTTKIGKGFNIYHGFGITIHRDVIIGDFVKIRQLTTIGNSKSSSKTPRIGNYVDIGAHSIIIGDIEIGDNVSIGAGSIVTKSIPPNSIVYGNPLKIINKDVDE